MEFILSALLLSVLLFTQGGIAYGSDYRNFYGIVWRGSSSDNIRYAKQMGYDYVAHQGNMNNLPEASNTKFYVVNPELRVTPVHFQIDLTKTYSPEEKAIYENYFTWKSNTATFPNNIATGWWYSDEVFLPVYDFQQQTVIDETISAIISKVKSYENLSISYTFAGLMWDVPDLKGDFWTGWSRSGGKFVNLGHWTGNDSCASADHVHDYSSYTEGKASFYKELYRRVKEEFPDARFISEPYIIYDRWIKDIKDRPDAAKLMPDMLTQEASGTTFVDDTRIFDSGLITKDRVGLTTPGIFDENNNRLHAAKAAINGSWFNWFGRFGGSGDMPDYANIYDVPARLQLIRVLPNWDNLVNIPLEARTWDGDTYISPNSYVDSHIIYSRHHKTGKIFVVFLNTAGSIKLQENETITSVMRTNGLFIETVDGIQDVEIENNEIRLTNPAYTGKGYIITTSEPGADVIPPAPPSNVQYVILQN